MIRRHWPTLAVLLVLGALYADARCSDIPALRAEVRAAKEAAADADAESDRWEAIADSAQARAEVLSDSTEAAHARADSLDALTPTVVTRWRTLPDTASVATVRAAADSTIAHLTDVAEHWREAFVARTDELGAVRAQLAATENERDAQRRRAENLQRAVAGLEDQLSPPSPWWSTGVLVAGGGAIGYGVGGLRGAAIGAAGGLAASVVWHGLDDLVGL